LGKKKTTGEGRTFLGDRNVGRLTERIGGKDGRGRLCSLQGKGRAV